MCRALGVKKVAMADAVNRKKSIAPGLTRALASRLGRLRVARLPASLDEVNAELSEDSAALAVGLVRSWCPSASQDKRSFDVEPRSEAAHVRYESPVTATPPR